MKKRLFLYSMLIIFLGLLCFFLASLYMTYTNNLNFARDTVTELTRVYAGLYDEGSDPSDFVKAAGDTRLTIIAADGSVLADSRPLDVNNLENHLMRPEIQAAAQGAPATALRYSETLGIYFIYYALMVPNGDGHIFLRAAIPVAQVDAYFWRVLPLLAFTLILVALICFFFTRRITAKLIAPLDTVQKKLRTLSKGEYKPMPFTESYDEINKITGEIDELAAFLQDNIENLRNEKAKLDYILDNIGDGLFALDEEQNIALINAGAIRIFNATADIVGKKLSYLTYDKMLTQAIEDCISLSRSALFEFASGGNIFLVSVKHLPDTRLAMVILSDVTENRESAKRREEFFANASHELKTPLTAIKGFNELIAIGNKDEAMNRFVEGISRETDRMMSLITDMLKLSELESTRAVNPVAVSLAKTADEVKQTLTAEIGEKHIAFQVKGDAIVSAEPAHMYELIKNLAENAIRYNNQGGAVTITINANTHTLSVSDTGIGISPIEQARIFERFYRVEKSRSPRNGGTGLGLAIVKHICALYEWSISLKSKPGDGTEIVIRFN